VRYQFAGEDKQRDRRQMQWFDAREVGQENRFQRIALAEHPDRRDRSQQ
jgi:hypothetical protein